MHNSTLIEILSTFDKEDFKRFEDIVNSPYFNKKSTVTALFRIIKNVFPDLKTDKISRDIVWKKLFPGKKYNYGVMKNLIYDLQKLAERSLEMKTYETLHFDQKKNLLDALSNKELYTLFEKVIKTAKTKLEKIPVDQEYYLNLYYFESKQQSYLYNQSKYKDPDFCNPLPASEYLSSFFFLSFFGQSYNSLFQSKYYNKTYNTDFIITIFDFFEKSLSKDNELIRMFYYTLKTAIDSNDDEAFYALKELSERNMKKLNRMLYFNSSIGLINYSNFQIMKGRTEFVKHQFEVYKTMIESDQYYGDAKGNMGGIMFANIVGAAANAGEVEWAENFLENFKNKIEPAYRKHSLILANVILSIKKKKFDDALNYLSKAESRDLIQKINIRRFQIIIYYELGYTEELYSLIDTSKHFIANDKKSSEAVKNAFSNFITMLKLLISYKEKNFTRNESEISVVRKTIESSQTPNKVWLLKKVEEL